MNIRKYLLWKLFCVSLSSKKYVSLFHSFASLEHLLRYGGVKLFSVARNRRLEWCWVCDVRCVARVKPTLWRLYMIRLTHLICVNVAAVFRRISFTLNNCWKYDKVYFKYQLAQKNFIKVGLSACAGVVQTRCIQSCPVCVKNFYRDL